ncbi:riboflavin kinase [Sistotremastrum suecicum HHB10207 ss-3]|uniref:Riboflavin kinase n=1 Tax=Sistotremastrum suecicum HHB10207 ss-3 TaxID=1314776 RepID=A0A165YXV5_9AGAM|nr:riboflavin kinase [Sistotremastrum suecicum HHB10207 ss-3]
MADVEDQPPVPVQTHRGNRPEIVGGDEPESPFPVELAGPVQRGFGRGGKDLGCPTANLPEDTLHKLASVTKTGIYFGFAQVSPPDDQPDALTEEERKVYPMVMSLGWNPYYKNEKMTAEVHIMYNFRHDFYGFPMRVIVLGYIRPELDYISREALIDDIETDKRVGVNSLARPGYKKYATDPFFPS